MIIRHSVAPVTAAAMRALLAGNAPGIGQLVVLVRPDIRRSTTLVGDLLTAMGKRADVSGTSRTTAADPRHLQVWLRAHEIQRVTIVGGSTARAGVVAEVVEELRRSEVDVWLVDRLPVPRHHEALLSQLGACGGQLEELLRLPACDPAPATAPFPGVPDDDYASFRWSCRVALSDEDFARVDAVYAAAIRTARRWWQQGAGVRLESVPELLRLALSGVREADEAVTVLRALQQVSACHGVHIAIDEVRLAAAGPLGVLAAPDDMWASLLAYRQPYRGAMCVLAVHGLGIADARELPLAAVAANGRWVEARGRRHHVPDAAAVLLRAMREERELEGVAPTAPLLTNDGLRVSERRLAQALSDAALDLGVPLNGVRVLRHVDDAALLRRSGVTLEWVGS